MFYVAFLTMPIDLNLNPLSLSSSIFFLDRASCTVQWSSTSPLNNYGFLYCPSVFRVGMDDVDQQNAARPQGNSKLLKGRDYVSAKFRMKLNFVVKAL
jgi:hypothetical protein